MYGGPIKEGIKEMFRERAPDVRVYFSFFYLSDSGRWHTSDEINYNNPRRLPYRLHLLFLLGATNLQISYFSRRGLQVLRIKQIKSVYSSLCCFIFI